MYTKAPSTKKTWRDSLPIDMLLSAVSVLVVAQSSSEIPEGRMNYPVQLIDNGLKVKNHKKYIKLKRVETCLPKTVFHVINCCVLIDILYCICIR